MKNPPSWVLDTNVLVSGLLNPHGFPGRLIDSVLAGALRLTYDDRIENEYREVLARPKFGIALQFSELFSAELKNQDPIGAAPWKGNPLPDPDDLPFLEAALYATDQILVTGNTKHCPAAVRGDVTVLSPGQAWKKLTQDIR